MTRPEDKPLAMFNRILGHLYEALEDAGSEWVVEKPWWWDEDLARLTAYLKVREAADGE